MKKVEVNAMGQQCPVPVVMTTKALKEITEPAEVEVHVDNEVAVQNVLRLAGSRNFEAKSRKVEDNHFVITINALAEKSAGDDKAPACTPDMRGNTVVVFSSDRMGSGDDGLGKLLMKSFIYALSQLDELPKAMIFYNGGAALTVEGSESLEDLKNMEAQGVEIMTCGTCLDYLKIKDKLAVGSIGNMYTIVETMNGAGKILRP